VDNITVHRGQGEHGTLDSDVAYVTPLGTTQPRAEPLDADPLMRAAAELLAENASLLAQRDGGMV